MPTGLCVLVMPVSGPTEFYPNAHIAGVRDGALVIAGGPPQMNGLDPVANVLRQIPLADIRRVELLGEVDND